MRVGTYVAVYLLVHKLYQIAVLNPVNGHIRWRAWASPGAMAPSRILEPSVIGNRVVYLAPKDRTSSDYGFGYITIADGASGRVIAKTDDAYAMLSMPVRCGRALCLQAESRVICESKNCPREWDSRLVIVDPKTGGSTYIGLPVSADYWPAGPEGLSDMRGYDGSRFIGRVVTSWLLKPIQPAVLWKVKVDKVFGKHHDFDDGYWWTYWPHHHRYVGTIGTDIPPGSTKRMIDRGDVLVGLDDETGRRTWKRTGDSPWCLRYAKLNRAAACHFGPGSHLRKRGEHWVFENTTVTLRGFDVDTGATSWEVPLASPDGQTRAHWLASFALTGQRGLIVPGPRGRLIVDLATGRTRPLGNPMVMCTTAADVTLAQTLLVHTSDNTPFYRHRIADSITPCDLKGHAVKPSGPIPSWAGVQVGSIRVVLTKHGLVGYRQGGG